MNNKAINSIDGSKSIEEQLIQLFKTWKREHAKDPNCEKTCPGDMCNNEEFVKSFIADGCADFKKYKNAKKKILFILKEPGNLRSEGNFIGNRPLEKSIKEQWYSYVVENKMNCYDKSKIYYRNFKAMADIIGVDLSETAMMNLNKRGGYAAGTNDKRLECYTRQYEGFIRKQIDILKPDIIVACLGNGRAKNILFDIKDNEWYHLQAGKRKTWLFRTEYNGAKVYGMNHPGKFSISYDDYKELFKEIYNK